MKTLGLLFLIITFFPVETKQAQNAPYGLMIELIREPGKILIMDLDPEFSWIVPASSGKQTAYQILIASSKEKLEKNIGDISDTKKVAGSRSTEVESGARSLSANSTFFWKVRIWDEKGKPTDYSEIQAFSTGSPEVYESTSNKFQIALIDPVKLLKTGEGNYFADFGKDAFGTLILDLVAVKEETIVVHLGEKINAENRIDRNPGGSLRYQEVLLEVKPGINQYTLNLQKDKRNTGAAAIQLPDYFGIITPFRYVELEGCNYNLKPENLHQKAFWYFFDDNMSSFSSSDSILNMVWDICKYSMKATSFAGLYVDGDRERIPYEADAYINQLGHYYTDREYSMARRTNEYFIKHPTWPTEWLLHTVPMFYYDYLFTGNIESVKNYYEELKHKTLISLSREDGLISSKNCTDEIMTNLGFSNAKERLRDIVDWPPSQKDTGWKLATPEGERDGYEMVEINTVVNAFYYNGLKYMSLLARELGENEDADFYRNQSLKVKKAINSKLLSASTGIYTDGESSEHSSLHANMMALAFDIVPDENKVRVVDFIKSRGMACSVYGSQYLMEALYRAGEEDYALSLLTASNDRSWYNMIRSGSTITMEAWDMKYKPNSDWNHAWGAAPANIIPGFMWGISPAEPGFAKAIIKPQLSTLKESKVSVPTIRGNIEAEYKISGNSREYIISIPGNMECDFVIPGNNNGRNATHGVSTKILLNNKTIDAKSGIIKLNPGKNQILINY